MKKITFILIVFLLFIISSCSYNRYQDENFQYYKMKVSNEYVYAVTGLTEIGKSKNVLVFPNEYNGLKTYIKNSNLGPGSGKINSSNLKLFLPKEFTYVREDYFRFIYDEENVNGTSKLIILSNDLENLNLNEVKYLKNIFVSNQIYKSMNNSNYSFNRANVSYNYNYNDSPNGGYYWIDDYDGEVISFIPPTPSRDGYTFMGWYKESECINEWNFNEDIVPSKEFIEKEYIYNETTLYAKWKVNNIENDEILSHKHLICDECGKCTDAECDGEVLDKCLGHVPKHEHVVCPECGKCTDAECDKEENKCLGHTPKHEHIACQDCGKCISESCDSLKDERCQGCIKICLTNKTYVSHLDLDIDSPKYYIIDTYEEFIKFVNENSLMEIQFGEYHGAINVDYYNDLYFPAYDDYDEAFFLQNSLMLFCIKDYQRRQNPQLVYDVKYENKILNVHASLSVDAYAMNFKGIIFQFAEVSKFLINDYQEIEYIFDKFVILE